MGSARTKKAGETVSQLEKNRAEGIRNDTHDLVGKQREQLKQSEMKSNCSGPILHTE